MKAGIEITPLTARLTGIGYYTRHLVRALCALPEKPDLTGFASGMRAPQLDDISLPHRWVPLPTRALYQIWDKTGFPRVDRFLGGLQVYHAVNYVLPPLKKAAGILTIHDLAFLLHPEWSSPKIVGPFRKAITRHARQADRIIVPSLATQKDAVKLLDIDPEKIRLIPHGGDPDFAPIPPEEARALLKAELAVTEPFFLCVGTLEPRKNLGTLFRAFLKTDLPHKLVFVGGQGWGDQLLAEHTVTEKDEKRLVFTGYLEDRALFPALYSLATAFVFPTWYEGFGIPILEAMACGCPVISSNTSSLPEVAGEAARYVAPDDVEGWTEAMEELAADPALQQELQKAGLNQAQNFSWEKTAAATWACYQEFF